MKRSSSSEFASESKRFEASYPPPSPFQQQMQKQQQQMQQQQQIQAQQQLQVQQQMQAQQQQQFQAQQQQYQQQMQAAQQQQQQQFYNQAAYYPMNSVNYTPYVPTQSPVMYNSSPSWNFMSSPPPFFPSSPAPAASTSQPPLPPPELKPEKPPLPKEPEPGNSAQSTSDSAALQGAKIPPGGFNGIGRPRGPGPMSGHRMRGGMNGGFNGFNPGMGMRGLVGGRPNGMHNNMRGRGRRNHHFFPQMPSPQLVVPPMDLQRIGEIPDFARLIEEDQPAGPEKLTIFLNNTDNGRVQVNKKAKRKPMSTRYTRTKMWVREEAEAAIALEKEFNRMQKRPMLILKFPDPDLNKFIVKKYSPLIDSVHFQQPSTPRYCFVQLKEDADVDKVISTIRQIPFGTGTITCELKHQLLDDQPVTPEEIDPYTLYIGNLPTHISVRVVKQYFPNAQRIDIGYAQRMRYTRYAFIRYNTVAEAMASYKRTVNALLDSRSLIVRFRRQKGNIGLPGETKLSAPRRDGKEILPDKEPKVLEHDAEGHEMETLPEEMDSEHIEEDADDEEEEDDGTNAEKAKETPKEIVVKPFAAINPKPSTEVTPSTSAADVRPSSEAPPKDSRKSNVSTKSPPPDPESFGGYPNEYPDCPSDSDSDIAQAVLRSGKPVLEETDTKTSVLAEATALMRKNKTMALRQKLIESDMLSLPNLPPPKPGDIKIEETDEDDSSDDGINMLGTRVKEEPNDDPPIRDAMAPATLDDMYLDDYEYDDLDCEPEEEDDDWEPPQFTPKSGSDWEAIRRNELNTKEDKPDLDVLSNIHHLLPSSSIAPIPADLEPKAEVEDDSDKPKKPDPEPLTETEELKQMFAQLNSDPECDDDDTFFG